LNSLVEVELLVISVIRKYSLKKTFEITLETPLLGSDRFLDSMNLIEVCLNLEDLAKELGFEFDWTSSDAMSKSLSIFRTVRSLSEEFYEQKVRAQ
jgi:hypothetical protein